MVRSALFPVVVFAGSLAYAASPDQSLEAKAERARLALAEERFEEAAKLYTELVRADPKNTGLRLSLGIAEQGCGRHASAVEQFRRVVEREPKFAAGWRLLGDSLAQLADHGQAIAAYETALRLEPGRMDLQLALASQYKQVGRYSDAANLYLQVGRFDPGEARAWYGLGCSYLAMARTLFAALEKDPSGAPWLERLRAGTRKFMDCADDSLPCRFERGEYWQLLEAAGNDPSPESRYWRIRALLVLTRRALDQLADLPPTPDIRDMLRDAERIQNQSDRDLLEKP